MILEFLIRPMSFLSSPTSSAWSVCTVTFFGGIKWYDNEIIYQLMQPPASFCQTPIEYSHSTGTGSACFHLPHDSDGQGQLQGQCLELPARP